MKILIVEDDATIARFVQKGLKEKGHNVVHCDNGKDGLFIATSEKFDVLIVDRMLPNVDGLTIVQTLRVTDNQVPVLFLSALDKVDDKVKGLKAGGDDYLVKPFSFDELIARVEVLYKRSHLQQNKYETVLKVKDLELNILNRSVSRNGKKIELQAREFNLLEYLLRNKGQVVTRTMLLEHLWDYSFDPQTNVIDVHVSRLRNKIDKEFHPPLIETVRGAGYIIYNE